MMRILILTLIACGLIAGCTGLRHVPQGEQLYTGADIRVVQKIPHQKKAVKEVKDIPRPKPNSKFIGMRPLLWLYYTTHPRREKGFRHWVKTKVAEPPVYMSMVDPKLVVEAIDARLYNKGYLTSTSAFSVHERKHGKTASVTYDLHLSEPYHIRKVIYPEPSDSFLANLGRSDRRTLLKSGARYDLDVILQERARIEQRLKRHGFYHFRQEHLLYQMDTSLGRRMLDLYVTLKPETPAKATMVCTFREVNVYPDYKSGSDTLSIPVRVIDSINYYDDTHYIRPDPIVRGVYIKSGQIYDKRRHTVTLNRLNGLGVFKLVNLNILAPDSAPDQLKANIFLSPLPKKSLTVEMQGVSKSNNFIGPALALTTRNRNAFRGAELMVYNLRGSFETQFNGLYKGRYTYEINPRVELYVPRFMVPFRMKRSNYFVPRTKYTLDYSYLSRVGYFNMNAFKFTFGYRWKESLPIDHDLSLININYFRLTNTSPGFNELLKTNVVFRRRFEEQLISGTSYSFFYNGQVKHRRKNQVYFNGNVEAAGNTLSLYKSMMGDKPSADNPSTIFSIRYAQFVKLDFEVRDYIHLRDKHTIATRFIAGWGIPYGNASTMPYIKQFFSGGAYSVRGFPAYSLGPGTYNPPDSLKNIFFLQQGGEIKLEGNIEYRYPIVSVLRGAFFIDVGNVWLNSDNPEIPGGEFHTNEFMNQLAVGAGTGFRVDLDFFVLRLDLGIPLRKPWLADGEQWVYDDFDIASPSWRDENLVFNIAFGYPF